MSVIISGHPSMADLAAFALGKLDAPTAETIHNHLAGCPECRTVVETTPGDTLLGLLQQAGAKSGDTPSVAASVLKGTLAVPNSDFDVAALPIELRDHPRYRIIRKLGEGGMGAVYEAEHRMMERVVAIKVISAHLVDSPAAIERFQREVRAAAKLEHVNIVRAYDADQAGGSMLLAMEFVKGRTLAEVIAAKGPLPIAYACQCVRQAALGLQHAADHGMVHRDIKPQNLMVAETGMVKVLDFGLAKLVSERATRAGLTGKNMVMGTPEYMAPEQARDTASADIRADIYALGCTLFCLLTGRPPFAGATALEIVTKQVIDAPPRVTDLRPEAPEALADLIGRTLAKDPADRPQTPRELAEALAPFTKPGKPRVTVGPAVTHRHRWPIPAALAAGAVLTALVMATVIWVKTSEGYVRVEAPDGAEVQVDGEVITVQPYRITVDRKEHKLVVLKDGVEIHSESISIKDNGRTIVATLGAPPPPAIAANDGFVPLFNGNDLTGWKTHGKQPGYWRVENGILIGSGQDDSYLYTERGDYKNYHLRAEARINEGGDSGVFFRSPFGPVWPARDPSYPSGYEAQINSTYKDAKTGSLFVQNGPGSPRGISVKETLVPAGQWFVMEAIAEDNHLVIKVDGKTTADYWDEKRTFVGGHIALQKNEHVGGQKNAKQTVIEFRKIEVKELEPAAVVVFGAEKSEWAGLGVVKDRGNPMCTAWTFTERHGQAFKALARSGTAKALYEGVIDANGRMTLEARQILAPQAKPREAMKGTGEVGSERMMVFVENPNTGATARVDYKRLWDGGKSFVFPGRWMCFDQPSGWRGVRSVNEDGTLIQGNDKHTWTRDGGLISISFGQWLIIDPDKPNELNGAGGGLTVRWIRQ